MIAPHSFLLKNLGPDTAEGPFVGSKCFVQNDGYSAKDNLVKKDHGTKRFVPGSFFVFCTVPIMNLFQQFLLAVLLFLKCLL